MPPPLDFPGDVVQGVWPVTRLPRHFTTTTTISWRNVSLCLFGPRASQAVLLDVIEQGLLVLFGFALDSLDSVRLFLLGPRVFLAQGGNPVDFCLNFPPEPKCRGCRFCPDKLAAHSRCCCSDLFRKPVNGRRKPRGCHPAWRQRSELLDYLLTSNTCARLLLLVFVVSPCLLLYLFVMLTVAAQSPARRRVSAQVPSQARSPVMHDVCRFSNLVVLVPTDCTRGTSCAMVGENARVVARCCSNLYAMSPISHALVAIPVVGISHASPVPNCSAATAGDEIVEIAKTRP
jgi:hypothetical protein